MRVLARFGCYRIWHFRFLHLGFGIWRSGFGLWGEDFSIARSRASDAYVAPKTYVS